MNRQVRIAVRGAVSEALVARLTDGEFVVDGDGDVDCVVATLDALNDRTEPTADDRDRIGGRRPGRTPVVALSPEASAQAAALDAGADRCVTLTERSATDARNVAAAVRHVVDPTDYDRLVHESLDALADFFFLFDTEMRLLVWNDAVREVTGYSDAELAEMNPLDLISEEDVVEVATAIQRAIGEGRATEEGDILTKDGERIPYEFTGTALTDADGDILGVSGIGRDVSERYRRERTLERQAESLETLNRINEVIRNVNQDLVRAQTREDVERAVVDRLAAESGYRFAWVGEYEAGCDRVVPRTWAGECDTPFETDDDERQTAEDAAATVAVHEGSMQVTHPSATDTVEPLGGHEVAAVAAVPLVYRGVTYGVLCVYADRSDAFDGTERAVFRELGETIAYAIGAAERRRALVADTVVELELVVDEVDGIPQAATTVDAAVSFRGAVPESGESLSQFYRIDGDIDGVVEAVPDGTDLSVVRTDDDGGVVRVTGDGSFSSLFADYGGTISRVHVEDGGFRLVAVFPQRTDVRSVLDAVRERLPSAKLVARRERERSDGVESAAALTDRQLTVLTTAYHLGFFDSPRANTGGEVAEELGISTPTFHEHIRIAERKLVEAFLTADDTGDERPR
ncbi:bacterio-opsin activator domain-containing protein [Halomarina oriensis]|uniref:PAS domain S-box protein n=1 Tax=Halomarina oriensis TaxID=671145 RepID=A0A6B0GRP8_9EURY|nr:bacterio-opsin activator domain-containing protein [Halomarina oriensis]MWG34348.1 PAS domain S-box protein [Halomarina oriensis]